MTTVTREINNTGAPLVGPDGTVLASTDVVFTLVDTNGERTDAWDATTEERVVGRVTATTNVNGEFTVDLWPNDRGNVVTWYDVWVDATGSNRFRAQLASGAAALSWWDFKSHGVAITAAEAETIQSYIDSRLGLSPYDTVVVVDAGGNGDYTTITAALASISDAGTSKRYQVLLKSGTYSESLTVPDYVSIKGQSTRNTIIFGAVEMVGKGSLYDMMVWCEEEGVAAITTNDYTWLSGLYVVSNVAWVGDQVAIDKAGTDDTRIMNCFVYARNTNAGGRAVAYKHSGTSGDMEAHNNHVKHSVGSGSAVLAHNASTGAGSDIIITGSWSVFGDILPIVGDNDNVDGGQIKASMQYENDTSDVTAVTSSGDVVHDVGSQAHIVDADGTLADITTKFNTLLTALESKKILLTS